MSTVINLPVCILLPDSILCLLAYITEELTLAEKIIAEWKRKTQEGSHWAAFKLGNYISTYWSEVRSARAAMGGGKKNPATDPATG